MGPAFTGHPGGPRWDPLPTRYLRSDVVLEQFIAEHVIPKLKASTAREYYPRGAALRLAASSNIAKLPTLLSKDG